MNTTQVILLQFETAINLSENSGGDYGVWLPWSETDTSDDAAINSLVAREGRFPPRRE